jgi:hypothetical protein
MFSKRSDLLEDSEPELRLQLKEKSEQVAMMKCPINFNLELFSVHKISQRKTTKYYTPKLNLHNIQRHLHDIPQLFLLF